MPKSGWFFDYHYRYYYHHHVFHVQPVLSIDRWADHKILVYTLPEHFDLCNGENLLHELALQHSHSRCLNVPTWHGLLFADSLISSNPLMISNRFKD